MSEDDEIRIERRISNLLEERPRTKADLERNIHGSGVIFDKVLHSNVNDNDVPLKKLKKISGKGGKIATYYYLEGFGDKLDEYFWRDEEYYEKGDISDEKLKQKYLFKKLVDFLKEDSRTKTELVKRFNSHSGSLQKVLNRLVEESYIKAKQKVREKTPGRNPTVYKLSEELK